MLDTSFSIICSEKFDAVWGLQPLEEPAIGLLIPEHRLMLRFFDLIRLRRGEKIPLSDFINFTSPQILTLYLAVAVKRGSDAIEYQPNEGDPWICFRGNL